MSDPISATIGAVASIGGGYLSAREQRKAAGAASAAEVQAAQLGVEEQRRQFDKLQELLSPFVSAGETALSSQLSLIGLGGEEAERAAIERLQTSPTFEALTRQGEEAILQQASATGGLRGGNVQGALAQFRPNILNQLIEQQYGRLGGLAQMGQASAAGVGAAGVQTGQNIAGLFGQQGAARAQEALLRGRGKQQLIGDITGLIGLGIGGGF